MKLVNYSINGTSSFKCVNDDYVLESGEIDSTADLINADFLKWTVNYAQRKDCFQYLGKTFDSQSDDVKDIIIKYCAVPQLNCVQYLISKGMSMGDAVNKYIEYRSEDVVNLISVCANNARTPNLLKVLFEFFDQPDCERFLKDTKDLIFFYSNYAIYGKKYGNSIDGILDFIEDYGTYAGTGLSTYTVRSGKTLADLIAKLKDVLTNGRCNISM